MSQPKCNCQKQITFTPKQFQLEGGSVKNKLQKIFKGTQTAWKKSRKPAIKSTAPLVWPLELKQGILKLVRQRLIFRKAYLEENFKSNRYTW